ncbi:MAG: aminotransferase class V-fold PLP-dependent enzyme [Flavobacteriaceae bacterium]
MLQNTMIFPALKGCIYADTAAAGLMYDDLLEWRREHDQGLLLNGSSQWPEKIAILRKTRETIHSFFNCLPTEVALTPNFSIGLNLLLENQDPKQKVLLVENDYPSVNWPFENRGFDVSYVVADEQLEQNIAQNVADKGISILALSLVQWLNGIKIDNQFLIDLKKEHPSLLIVADGTQYCGAYDLNFGNSGIDVLGTSGYKWLLGGYGNGFMLIREESQRQFSVSTSGFNSAEGNLQGKNQITFCKRLEPGHLDSLNFGSLNHSLNLLNQLGMDRVEEQNRRLSQRALQEFGQLGLLQDEVLARKEHGSIFRISGDRSVYDELLRQGVRCSWRSDGIRLSFHFYNTEKEIDLIAKIVKSAL